MIASLVMWELEHDSGQRYRLFNRSGADAGSVEVTAERAVLDGNGKDFVRRVETIPQDEPIAVMLGAVFGGTDPVLTIRWTGTNAERQTFGIRLGDI
jgi:hypothetical protein